MAEDKVINEENLNEENDNTTQKWQVFVNDISWSKTPIRAIKRTKELPTQLIYDIPENVIIQARKPKNVFNDIIETYVYNTLTKRYAYEVNYAQIWIMFDDKDLVKAGF